MIHSSFSKIRPINAEAQVFECSLMKREIGAAISVQTNAIRVLEYFGYDPDSLKGVDFYGVRVPDRLCAPLVSFG